MSDLVIIEAAINGATSKTVNPNVPVTEDEIVADALACFEAGAAIVHQHITDFNLSGEEAAEVYLGIWRRVLAERPDALWYPTINLGPKAQWYDHIPPLAESGLLRMGLSDPGSVNMGVPVDGLPAGSFVYTNTFDDVAHQLELCRTHRLGPSLAIYEPGFLRTVLAYHHSGQLPVGSFVKLYFSSARGLSGTAFGLPPSRAALTAYVELLDGTGLPWAVSAVGDDLVRSEVCRPALDAGGHLHLGLEFYAGDRTPTNVDLVTEAVEAVAAAGREVATSAEAAVLLGLRRSVEPAPAGSRARLMEAAALESVEDLTPEWMSAVLAQNGIAATVCRVRTAPVGNGQMGSCYRLFIGYDAGDGPDRLIVKLPATDSASRAAGQLGYRCETTFYREVANRLHLNIPRCYFAAMNESGDGFTLVLEDLAPAQPGDQIAGCSVDQARAAAVNVAGLHAPTWNDPSIRELDWLIPDLAAFPEVAAAFLVDATKQFLERYAVTRDTAATLRHFADRFVDWATGRPEPFALLHSDYRLDNLLFAESDATRPVTAVDWQVVTVGSPLRDIAFLVATGLPTARRRAGEKGIVEAYHRRLVALGVDGYGAEQCWEDYRYGLFQGPFITVLGAFVAQPTARGDRMFTIMAERSSTAITDLNAMALL